MDCSSGLPTANSREPLLEGTVVKTNFRKYSVKTQFVFFMYLNKVLRKTGII